MKTILVVGGRGMLGTDLVSLLRSDAAVNAASADIGEIDITDAGSIGRCLDSVRPDAIINCAAFTNVDACETQEQAAHAVNALGPELLAKACAPRGIRLLHVSTDYVFDGTKAEPYLPDDPPNPSSAYGRTKLAGEQAVAANCPDHLIVRTAWLYGTHGKNFVHTMLRLAKEKPELRVVSDQVGSPTFTRDLAGLLARLAHCNATGITHATNSGRCSWFEFACEIVKLAGLSTPVRPIPSSEYPTSTRRPAFSVLDCSRTERLAGVRIRHWRDALAEFLRRV
ncbi:MAG TPA: dTDP-4-dehydrorhamnose reductase [Planctomycetota bacterium]|nr:dTDP-4-dehydrorhamnose reductase [Planctomycetota bacterium]